MLLFHKLRPTLTLTQFVLRFLISFYLAFFFVDFIVCLSLVILFILLKCLHIYIHCFNFTIHLVITGVRLKRLLRFFFGSTTSPSAVERFIDFVVVFFFLVIRELSILFNCCCSHGSFLVPRELEQNECFLFPDVGGMLRYGNSFYRRSHRFSL